VLVTKRLSKHFGGIKALQDINFELYRSEVVGLVGDNGAGKSTLVKTITGIYEPDAGEIFFDGKLVHFRNPQDARNSGIETIYQDSSVAGNVDVADNIFIGKEFLKPGLLGQALKLVDRRRMLEKSKEILKQLNIEISSLTTEVQYLSGGQQKAVVVGRATYWNAKLIMMDEPTTALGVTEKEQVLQLTKRLKQEGVSIMYISHNLDEIFSIADRIVVLRLGRIVGDRKTETIDQREIVGLMMGVK